MEHRTILIHPGHDPDTRDKSDLSRRIFLTGIGIACLGFAPFLQACDNAFSRGEKGNGVARTGPITHGLRPPIDGSTPAKIQTATFALG
jgi:hypothetical protein